MKQDMHSAIVETSHKAHKSEKRELICEREGKTLYHSEKPDIIIQEFTDISPDESKKHSEVKQLCSLRNEISSYLFGYVEGFHVSTHFVSKFSPTAMVVKRTELIPMMVRIYNIASGSLVKRFGLKNGKALDFPVIEHYYGTGKRVPVMVNEYHMYAFNITVPEEYKQINRMASKVNAALRGLCDRRQLVLADLQLAFGRYKNQVVLSDELSPFTCHFLDAALGDRQDKFLPDHENAVESFFELHSRLKAKV